MRNNPGMRFTVLMLASTIATVDLRAAADTKAHAIGRLTSVGNGHTRTFSQYDARGRMVVTQHVQDGQSRQFATTFGYAQSGAAPGPGNVVVAQTFPDGERVSYTYDASGQEIGLSSTRGSTTEVILGDRLVNARGQIIREELGNGDVRTTDYDDSGHLGLLGIKAVNRLGVTIQDYTYEIDNNGNVTSMSDAVKPSHSIRLDYDSLNQLTTLHQRNGTKTYNYDEIGNLILNDTVVQNFGAGGRPHAISEAAGVHYGYDANGNPESVGAMAVQWTADNMPARVSGGGVLSEKSFVGEALWKKVEQGVTTYYLPSLRIENGRYRKYYGTVAERDDAQLRFYHPDHLGSSSVVTDRNGNVIRRASYLPWGQDREVEGSFTPKLQYNFKEKDATGFYDYGARLYNPVTGRFLSPDTSLNDGSNRYAYTGNNPWTRVDPSGHDWAAYTITRGNGTSYIHHYRWFPERVISDAEPEIAVPEKGVYTYVPTGSRRIAVAQWDVGSHSEPVIGRYELQKDGRYKLIKRVALSDKGIPPEWIRGWSDKATDTKPALNTQFIKGMQQRAPAMLEAGGYMVMYMEAFMPFLGAASKGNKVTQLAIRQASPFVSRTKITLVGKLDDIKDFIERMGGDYNILNDRDYGSIMQERWEDDVIRNNTEVWQIGPGGYYTKQEVKRFKAGGLRVTKLPKIPGFN